MFLTKQEQQRKKFLYDHTGVFAVKHNNATYFYRKDAQSNIVALLDSNGAVVVEYKYDAWGKCQTIVAAIEYFRKQRKVI